MHPLDRQVASRLTRYYLVALHVIALLSLGGLWLIRDTIHNHEADSRVLNVAGRQRMLSQRLTKLALLRLEHLPSRDTVLFDSLLQSWQSTHRQLRSGLLRMEQEYTVRKSPELVQKFQRLEPIFESMSACFVKLNDDNFSNADQKEALRNLLATESIFVDQMNDIVFQFDAESRARVKELERMETLLTAATLLTLLLEGLFVFRPVVRYTRQTVRKLVESEEALQASNQQLAITNEALTQSQQEVLRLQEERYQQERMEAQIRSAALMEGQEEERRRFARELHDGIGQMLTGLHLHAAKLKKIPFPEAKQKQRVEELSEYIQQIIQSTRQISHNLMPTLLEDYGLSAALQLLASQVQPTAASEVNFQCFGEARRLTPAQEIGLYRIAQEALTNALKHAKAAEIQIILHFQPNQIILKISDDGQGFDLEKARSWQSAGLENMQTRAQLIRATLDVQSVRQAGTQIEVILPINSY
ncbi:histidine kinase [Siphonobacter sp. SORGH_AS_0500]|uniref:ATP-binding protein n=1 Tax=Siphonobacter sp. SORGH_AS_0500 TaxID=1864824 RepID=UPI00285F896F|nr:histidine kinase [Siphonobacter sp. SORGH_AS_0500]MDR6197182.1 signal transduction histidine kinase [Siphonobacter sp. SORGH_AS_0500]